MIWMDVNVVLTEVPVNIAQLIDDGDFVSRKESVTFDQAGMDLVWEFTTTDGVTTQTPVTPTDGGNYNWTNQGNGMYTIGMPDSGGASIDNDVKGFGHFVGFATGVLPWIGPIIGFRAAALNNALIDGGDVLDVSITEIKGVSQSASDLKDFADAGYNPSTHKVNGVVLADGCTSNSDMRGTDGANTVVPPTEAQMNDRTLPSADYLVEGDTLARVTLVDTTAENTDMRGTDGANTVTPDAAGVAATPAQVNAQVLDVLNVDTFAEPGQNAPTATPTMRLMFHYLYKAWRNLSTQTASQYSLYNNAGDAIDQKSTDSDDNTSTSLGKVISGP